MKKQFLEPDSQFASKKTMNTIKLGTKVDGFEKKGRAWFVATELQSDIVVDVKDVKFYLHKFPLLSRSGRLNRLVFESRDTQKNPIQLDGIPGGPEAFELAAKFCYGMPVDLNASNVAALWCAAIYLEMTEDLEEGNLVCKAEAFFNLVVLGSWKDSIIVLRSCEHLFPWAEKLLIVQRCTESIAWKACTDHRGFRSPMTGHSSRMGSRAQSPSGRKEDNIKKQLLKDWWFDDVVSLPTDFFMRLMPAIKAKGMRVELVAAAVAHYALKWLPRKSDIEYNSHTSVKDLNLSRSRGRHLLEHILSILPRVKDVVPSRFLMHLIRVAHMLDADLSCKVDLEQRAGIQLESATVNDLLVPTLNRNFGTRYDVDLVQRLLQHYLRQDEAGCFSTSRSVVYDGFSRLDSGNIAGKIRVANLLDSYLEEVADDQHLSVSKFMELVEALPDVSRPSHDALYGAIDTFLKAHPDLKDEERKDLCRVMDCKKLSIQSCMHAAQNERLPLRTIMQVLFFEHLKLKNPHALGLMVPLQKPTTVDAPKQDGCAALQQEIRTIRYELEKMKAEFSEFQHSFRSLKEQQLHEKQKNLLASRWKKLGRSLHNLSAGLPPPSPPKPRPGEIPQARYSTASERWRRNPNRG